MGRRGWLAPLLLLALGTTLVRAGTSQGDSDSNPDSDSDSGLGMSPAVVCRSIDGFENYEPLPGGALTSDDKLLVYYRPLNYRVERKGATLHIHLVQDGQIRRRGEKAVLMAKQKLLDIDYKSKEPEGPVYLRNTVALKGLPPGDYDFDIILYDVLAPGTPTARQTLEFKVVPVAK
jgi:hypothetical protein